MSPSPPRGMHKSMSSSSLSSSSITSRSLVSTSCTALLYQHFFWFYSHPAVYIMILPGMGIISELIAVHARRKIFGYKAIAFSSVAIALLGFLVWGHHMFVAGQSQLAATL